MRNQPGEHPLKPSLIAVVLLAFSSLSHAETFVKDGNPCIGGVCVSDDIAAIKGVKWEQAKMLDKPIATMKVSKSDVDGLLHKLAPQPRTVVAAAAPFIVFAGFDSDGITKLSRVKGFCAPIPLGVTGSFRSESGYLTRVIANVEPSVDGSTQALRVTMIIRKFPNELTSRQVAELNKLLKERYSAVATFGRDIRKPAWEFRDTVRELWLYAPLGDDVRKQDLLRSYPGCGKKMKID